MKIYVHTEKGIHATILEEKKSSVVIELADTKKQKEISLAALAHWWEPIEGDLVVPQEVRIEPGHTTEEITPSEPLGRGTEDLGAYTDGDSLKMSDAIPALERLFDKLNGIYFESKLPKPVITVQSTPKAYGHCTTKKLWKSNGAAQYEINMGAEYINRQMPNMAATMCHEMVHLYCLENYIADTSQKGRYHNGIFKKEAEARDLKIDYDRANGHSATSPTDAFIAKLSESGFDMAIQFARITPAKKASSERIKAHKYACPNCGQDVRTTSERSLICGHCSIALEKEV